MLVQIKTNDFYEGDKAALAFRDGIQYHCGNPEEESNYERL